MKRILLPCHITLKIDIENFIKGQMELCIEYYKQCDRKLDARPQGEEDLWDGTRMEK